jgi:hypothetical protein
MKKGLPFLLLLLLHFLFAPFSGSAQDAGAEPEAAEAAVPFVSKLKARAVDSRIILTWRNPANLKGSLLLYRHSAQIDRGNLDQATRIARLAPEQESYEDSPPDTGSYYYAVLVEDHTGTVQETFVPYRNRTSEGVRVSVLPPAETAASRVTSIQASVVDEAVQVVFQATNPERELLLFRSNSPMTDSEDLLDAFAPIQLEAGTARFLDFPVPGVETYYAVLDTELFKLGKQELVPGENATIQPVVVPVEVERAALPPAATEVPGTEKTQAGGRPAATYPLPYLQLAPDSRSAAALPQRLRQIDPRTREAVARLLASAPPPEPTRSSVVILPEDREGPAAGESTSLRSILEEYLLAGDYREAESKLQGFLNLRRSAYTEARVRFYLAQAYYFQGLYEEALLEFVLAQDQLYAPVQPWLESCFRQLWWQQ